MTRKSLTEELTGIHRKLSSLMNDNGYMDDEDKLHIGSALYCITGVVRKLESLDYQERKMHA